MKLKHNFPKLTVEWADHWATETNKPYTVEEVRDMAKRCVRETTGYLIFENRYVLALAGTIEEDGSATEINFFMKKAIISRSDKEKPP